MFPRLRECVLLSNQKSSQARDKVLLSYIASLMVQTERADSMVLSQKQSENPVTARSFRVRTKILQQEKERNGMYMTGL